MLAGLVVLLLGAGVLTSAPAAANDGPVSAAPVGVRPGSWTKPIYPERSIPAYASPRNVRVRAKSGSGGAELEFGVPTPPGSTLVWGDWDGDGATTPAIYLAGSWTIYNTMIGPAPAPTAQFYYGAPGDKPVVGDWNGDRKTDIGIVRANAWSLKLGASAGRTWRRLVYGLPTDVPVAGDWDKNGRDDVGVFRSGEWFLRTATDKAAKTGAKFRFGVPTDYPVVGDWNGDGADTVGVVRDTTWYLANSNEKPKVDVKRVVNRAPDAVPAPWRTLGGPRGAACPTATAHVGASSRVVAPLVKPSLLLDKLMPADPSTDPVGQNLRLAFLNAQRYLLGHHYEARWADVRGQRYTDVLARSPIQERAVRLPAMAALTVATATRTKGHYDAAVGRTTREAIAYAGWLTRSIACTHRAISPGGWGGAWQTPHWAMLAGEAGWLLWDRLTPQVREYVAQMVVSEADYVLTRATEYWADKSGTIVSPGNTKAEENAWNAALLELAVNMMPTHPRMMLWRTKAVDLEVASFATLNDMSSSKVVNGLPLSTRLRGANAFNDATVENHHRIHPDYMTNIQQLWWAADFARLANRATPAAAFHNAELVYQAFSSVQFQAGSLGPNGVPYAEPGGSIYRPGSGDVYFPQGTLWGAPRRAHFINFDAHASAYRLDVASAIKAEEALSYHVLDQLALQAQNADGRTYSSDPATAVTQDAYPGREEYAAQQLASAWMARYLAKNTKPLVRDNRTRYAVAPEGPIRFGHR